MTGPPQTHFLDDDTTISGLRGGWKSDRVVVIQRHPKTPSRPSRTKCFEHCRATVFHHHSIGWCAWHAACRKQRMNREAECVRELNSDASCSTSWVQMATVRHRCSQALKAADYILFSLTSWRNMRWVQINCTCAWQPICIQTMCRHVCTRFTRFNVEVCLSCPLLTISISDTAKPSISQGQGTAIKVVLPCHPAWS